MDKIAIRGPARPTGHYFIKLIISLALFSAMHITVASADEQKATIIESVMEIETYPFDDPNPVPVIITGKRIYPYHKFDGYSTGATKKEWNVVVLENDYVKVFVLPELGGKVWGAIEKSTGEEFIYKNDAMKFRNIALRGPWVSGGIEFNFGIVGHTPAGATPVNYRLIRNADGSVSCVVGNMDLPSRTYWRVKITLPSDKAYFETEALWHNPTELEQSYYNWMTAAAEATPDLELYVPGNQFLGHGGEHHAWPINDTGRNISRYSQNDFGEHKSYHVVGSYRHFFGGYYRDKKFGFGHWAPYEAMPGKKIWLWSQARDGAIWEDFLTDKDGQYIEFQAGRLFNQYEPASTKTPINKVGFSPYSTDIWKEIWFPFKETGGMSDASPLGVLNVSEVSGKIEIKLNALSRMNDSLVIRQGGETLFQTTVKLAPMQLFTKTLNLPDKDGELEVIVADKQLYYSSDKNKFNIKRPFTVDGLSQPLYQTLLQEADTAFVTREYSVALEKYQTIEEENPNNFDALTGLAKSYYRQGQFDTAMRYVVKALKLNTYHPEANYLAGIIYQATFDWINAKEAFGWAARDAAFRSVSFAKMGEVLIAEAYYTTAEEYLSKALDFNRHNINALSALALVYRKLAEEEKAQSVLTELLTLDPLNDFARFEQQQWLGNTQKSVAFENSFSNEFRAQSLLELALHYYRLNQVDEALAVLAHAGKTDVINQLWMAYLAKDSAPLQSRANLEEALQVSAEFVTPYRLETEAVLRWVSGVSDSWKSSYYLGLNLLALDRTEEGKSQLDSVANNATFPAFYLLRESLTNEQEGESKLGDLLRAKELSNTDWRVLFRLSQFYLQQGQYDAAISESERAVNLHPDQFVLGLGYAQILMRAGKPQQALDVLAGVNVLPSEHSKLGREIYEQALLSLALSDIKTGQYEQAIKRIQRSLIWQEHLGAGQPYEYDTRKQDAMLAYCYQQTGKKDEFNQSLLAVARYQEMISDKSNINVLLSLVSMDLLNEGRESIVALLGTLPDDANGRWVRAQFLPELDANPNLMAHDEYQDAQFDLVLEIAQLLNQGCTSNCVTATD